ncbi:hypothetical protein EV142_10799 [Flavobacterium circumlabens]|uniref:Uncharacterized protein n=1 Tax=Flavobacterium circumlabens TaxID=2133765 RepID=A0ABY2AWB4_9FLAO|nr:hypothetical protein EV142_10799 [Flavobacterium circumlabens]
MHFPTSKSMKKYSYQLNPYSYKTVKKAKLF